MKKSIISFILLFVCLPFVWANNAFSNGALSFEIPFHWEYNSSSDAFVFTIVNGGEDFDGTITLFAKSTETGDTYELFDEAFSVAAGSTVEKEYLFANEIGLPVGVYEFYFNYEVDGVTYEFVPMSNKGAVRAPSAVTRIPITTTTVPGKVSLSSNMLRSENHVSVYSTVELDAVDVVNMTGQVVRSKKLNNEKETTLEVESLGTGKYIVVGKTKKGVLSAKMFKIK